MNRLDALKAALEAKREAWAAFEKVRGTKAAWSAGVRHAQADDNLNYLLTDDTIAALIAVAEAAVHVEDWLHNDLGLQPESDLRRALAPLVKEADDD
ncbi:MAG: hypothetical protein M0R37_10455 [Bacteroidales bacterium]|jgi:hypothetical protein|nr:hypothetical protein [Bacteroidales bacterium]